MKYLSSKKQEEIKKLEYLLKKMYDYTLKII